MPTYDYECGACGHRFELFQRISEKPANKCPSCNRRKVRRLISGGGGIIFKGSGFYVTDSKSSGKKDASKPEKAAPKAEASEPSKKSDSGGQE